MNLAKVLGEVGFPAASREKWLALGGERRSLETLSRMR